MAMAQEWTDQAALAPSFEKHIATFCRNLIQQLNPFELFKLFELLKLLNRIYYFFTGAGASWVFRRSVIRQSIRGLSLGLR